ncbi:tetratricopeptide repeat protein [Streptomyces triculaminicus]|uniref:tetratricopeptide repeat protein n=1 Tax=Streptomyces triculaminicus TaxID=2816232 RepID=UPI0033EB52F4
MHVDNDITGGVFFNVVVQGGHITLELPREITPALTGMPAPSDSFTGRDADLLLLADVLRPGPPGEGAPRVLAVAGLPGVGKTELVLQAARHALRQEEWFPGGVLFINLFGYDNERRLTPERALGSLLRALGIPDEHLPADLQDRARLYRSVLSAYADQGRRILVVVDNVHATGQAEPLLSADPRIPVLVTSRHTLAGLGARLHDLSELDGTHAVELLRCALREARGEGDTRVGDEPAAAAELAGLCGRLPLALRIVAALLADLPRRPLSSMATALRDSRRRLERLAREDLAVRAAFDLSYEHLCADQARLFRMLPLNPGPDLSTEAAACLADADPYEAEELLLALARGHLIEAGVSYGRWRMHDLMRLYADERGGEEDRGQALGRLLDYYGGVAGAAASHLVHGADPDPCFDSRAAALAWLDDERVNLLVAAMDAPSLACPEVSLMLFDGLCHYLTLRRCFEDQVALGVAALEAANMVDSPHAQAAVLNFLGCSLIRLRRFDEADYGLRTAASLFSEMRDRTGEGGVLINLGLVLRETRRFEEAASVLERAIALHRETGDRRSEGMALANLGLVFQETRRYAEAVEALAKDVAICEAVGNRPGKARALNNLCTSLREEGRLTEAADASTEAGAIFRELGDRFAEAQSLGNLATILCLQGRLAEAIDAGTKALDVIRSVQAPHDEAKALSDLGVVLLRAGRAEQAVDPLKQAIQRFGDIGDRNREGLTLMNLGVALAELERFDDAFESYCEAVTCYEEDADLHGVGGVIFNCVLLMQTTGRLAGALKLLPEAIAAFHETGDQEMERRVTELQEAIRAALRDQGAAG